MLLDPELVAVLALPVEEDLRVGTELLGKPRLVEPDRQHRPAFVGHARLHALTPVAHRPHGDAADDHGDGGLVARAQVGHRTGVALAVLAREVLEQVAVGLDPERLERLALAPLQLDGLGEQARPRIERSGASRSWSALSSSLLAKRMTMLR